MSRLFISSGQIIGASASASVLPSEYSGLISFWNDWFDLLAVQGTLKSFLQHQSSKTSVLQHSAFFIVQLSYLYMTAGRTIALTIWTFAGRRHRKCGLISVSERFPEAGHSNPLQYSCLENLMDRGSWWVAVRGAAKSWIQLK